MVRLKAITLTFNNISVFLNLFIARNFLLMFICYSIIGSCCVFIVCKIMFLETYVLLGYFSLFIILVKPVQSTNQCKLKNEAFYHDLPIRNTFSDCRLPSKSK